MGHKGLESMYAVLGNLAVQSLGLASASGMSIYFVVARSWHLKSVREGVTVIQHFLAATLPIGIQMDSSLGLSHGGNTPPLVARGNLFAPPCTVCTAVAGLRLYFLLIFAGVMLSVKFERLFTILTAIA
jgi:hypothetical protein